MCMKTKGRRQFARHKRRYFCPVARHFTQKLTYFVGTADSFANIGALGNG
jgi:hypothetical protein